MGVLPWRASRRSRLARRGRRRNLRYMAPAAIFLGAFALYPLVELFRMSFALVNSANLIDGGWPWVGLENFRLAVEDPAFGEVVQNTLALVFTAVVATIVFGVAVALVLQRDTRTNRLSQGLMIFMWALPPLVTGSVWKFLLSSDGVVPAAASGVGLTAEPPALLADPALSIWSVTFVVSWVSIAFASLVMRAGLMSVPRDLLEAAEVDGASRWQRLRYVVLPALRPVILVQSVLTVLYAFRIFDFPFVMTQGGPGTSSTTLPFLAYKESFGSLEFGVGSALAVMSIGVVVLMTAAYLYASRAERAE